MHSQNEQVLVMSDTGFNHQTAEMYLFVKSSTKKRNGKGIPEKGGKEIKV
jgi:hypothetical protein